MGENGNIKAGGDGYLLPDGSSGKFNGGVKV